MTDLVKSGPSHLTLSIVNLAIFCVLDRFWAGTGVALAAISTIDKWLREKVVQGAFLMINFIGHLVFLVKHCVLIRVIYRGGVPTLRQLLHLFLF